MPAKLSFHVPDQAVCLRVLGAGADVVVGRDGQVDIPIVHASVSRRHARITEVAPDDWRIADLESKNGTRIDGARIRTAALGQQRWFALGDVYCEFELVDAPAVAQLQLRSAERRHASAAWTAKVQAGSDLQPLLGNLLNAIVELTEGERGFLLTPDGKGQLWLAACYAMKPDELGSTAFSGSRSAVQRAIDERRAIYLSSQHDRAWLADRASIVAQGIRALVCVPLLHDTELLGVAYVDTADAAHAFTDLDAQVLAALVDHGASVLAASRLAAKLAELSAWVAVDAGGMTIVPGTPKAWPLRTAPA